MTKDKEIVKLKNEIKQLKKKDHIRDEIVIQQSKMASMGEMIGNIAHQWRQPLMELSTLMMHEEAKIKLINSINKNDILEMINNSNIILKHMSTTIDDFKNFFATNKTKQIFSIAEQISTSLQMMNSTLKASNIKVNVYIKNNIKLLGFSNEYSQVIINILSNAKDIIIRRKINQGIITIKLYRDNDNAILEIEDNAGGIDIQPLDKVFDPFFTYKKKGGTGIGLFMSKLIVENNMNGYLTVSNQNNGACFKIKLTC